jgi:hypothetical protein
MLPIASDIALSNTAPIASSALPDAPVVPDPVPPEPRVRVAFATFLRASARRRARLADRIDPCTQLVEPVTG